MLISPFPPPVGGIASWTLSVYDYFKSKDIDIIYYNSKIKGRKITNRNYLLRFISGSIDVLVQFFNVFFIVLFKNPNIIHLNSSASLSLFKDYFFFLFLKNKKRKIIYHLHFGRIPELKCKNNWEWKLLLFVITKSDLTIVLDINSKKSLNETGLSNVLVLPNPICLIDKFNSISNRKNEIQSDGSVLFVGHIVKEKGVYELIESVKYISELKELILVGPCEENVKEDLLQLAGSKKSLIKFKGVLKKDQVLAEMRKCAVFVLPSYSEGFPMVILEAMSCSCAIIATKVGGLEEILANNSGICINVKNIQELAMNISGLLTNKKYREKLGTNAFNRVKQNYDIEVIGAQIQNIWYK